MTFELILAFNLVLIASILSPGPAFLMAVRTSLAKGRIAGVKTGLGLGLMASLWTLAGLLGLDIVFEVFPWAYVIIKTLGACYLLYIAWHTWLDAKKPIAETDKKIERYFRDGFLVNLGNPKSVLFAASVLAVIFPPNLSLQAKAFITFNHLILEILFYSFVAYAMNTETVSKQYLKAKTWLDRFAALVLGGLGLRLLFQR